MNEILAVLVGLAYGTIAAIPLSIIILCWQKREFAKQQRRNYAALCKQIPAMYRNR